MKFLLNEISSQDAWEKFYKGKIEEKAYIVLMGDVPKMDPFHKKILDLLVNHGFIGDSLMTLLKTIASYWSKFNQDQKQMAIEDIDRIQTFSDALNLLNNIYTSKYHTENKGSSDGLIILYEDEKLMVTCTVTYAANMKYYGFTHWCTASDIGGEYCGYHMFKRYTTDEYDEDEVVRCLIQMVVKKLKKDSINYCFQANVDRSGCFDVICDAFDNSMSRIELTERMSTDCGIDYLNKVLHNIDYADLVKKTADYRDTEDFFWNRKIRQRISTQIKKFEDLKRAKVFDDLWEAAKKKLINGYLNCNSFDENDKANIASNDVTEQINEYKKEKGYKFDFTLEIVGYGVMKKAKIFFGPELGRLSPSDYEMPSYSIDKFAIFNGKTGEILKEYDMTGFARYDLRIFNNILYETVRGNLDTNIDHTIEEINDLFNTKLYFYDGSKLNLIYETKMVIVRFRKGYVILRENGDDFYNKMFNTYTGERIDFEIRVTDFSSWGDDLEVYDSYGRILTFKNAQPDTNGINEIKNKMSKFLI